MIIRVRIAVLFIPTPSAARRDKQYRFKALDTKVAYSFDLSRNVDSLSIGYFDRYFDLIVCSPMSA